MLNTFTYFWCFLELFIGKFILNINNEHAQDYSCPGATKTHVNSHRCQTVHRGQVDPGVSELPRGNELSWDHVTGPKSVSRWRWR